LSVSGVIFGGAILTECSLSFVGLGDPGRTSWGVLIEHGFGFYDYAWWVWAFPPLAIVVSAALTTVTMDMVPRHGVYVD